MTRVHPFDLAFREFAIPTFETTRSAAPRSPSLAEFARIPEINSLLERIAPPDARETDPTVFGGLMHLTFLAYRFWEQGERTLSIERQALEQMIVSPTNDTARDFPTAYLQLPTPWFWGQIVPGAPHEPIDGLFVAMSGDHVAIAAILGLHPSREGFSQFTAYADRDALAEAGQLMRQPPFGPVMDGGAAAGFRSAVSEAELLHLTQLAWATVAE